MKDLLHMKEHSRRLLDRVEYDRHRLQEQLAARKAERQLFGAIHAERMHAERERVRAAPPRRKIKGVWYVRADLAK